MIHHNLIFRIVILKILLLYLISCGPGKQEKNPIKPDPSPTGSGTVIRNFIGGLWSVSDGNMLNNEGFYFQNDGIVRFVASEFEGQWTLLGSDSLKIIWQGYSLEAETICFKIDSIAMDRMVLSSMDETRIYRKVPFGRDENGIVLHGFMGSLEAGEVKVYPFELVSAKEIDIELNSTNPMVVFRFFEGEAELSSTGLRKWKGILTHGGKFRLEVINTSLKNSSASPEFSLRVTGY